MEETLLTEIRNNLSIKSMLLSEIIKENNKNYNKKTIIDSVNYLYVNNFIIKERKEYILNNCKEGDELSIIAEPTNQYDSNALQIIHNNTLIGYVVKRRNIKISKALMKGYKMYLYGLLYDNSKDYLDVSYILYTKK